MLRLLVLGVWMGSSASATDLSWVVDMQKQAEQYQGEAHAIVQKSLKTTKKCLIPKKEQTALSPQNSADTVYVFVSFSMPDAVLQDLARDVAAVGGKLVFRGLLEGSFRTTAAKLKTLGVDALIDPVAFHDHGITGVPTFMQGPHRLKGNVSLAYVLKQFAGEKL